MLTGSLIITCQLLFFWWPQRVRHLIKYLHLKLIASDINESLSRMYQGDFVGIDQENLTRILWKYHQNKITKQKVKESIVNNIMIYLCGKPTI